MMCQTPYSIVKRQNPLPRWVIWAFFIVLGCLANHSHAQTPTCTQNLALSKATPLDPSYLLSSSSRTRVIFKAEVIHVMDCTSFPLNTEITLMSALVQIAQLSSTPEIASSSPLNAKVTFRLQCDLANVCFDSAGINVIDAGDNPTSGIDGTLEIFYSGSNSLGQQCFNVTKVSGSGRLSIALQPFIVATSTCQRVTMKLILTVQQTGGFYKSNVATINWKGITPNPNFVFGVSQLSSDTFIQQPLTFNIQNGTCAVKLSNTLLSFGVLKTSQVNALANGGVAKTLPFSLDINNCVGTSLGKKKMLRWIFDDPKPDDFTRMENTPFGSAKGISAQIIADAKFDASGNAMASNIITNGEKYMASGKAADVQTLNYKVNIIRNSDAVVEGAFFSKATVVLDYQ